MRECIARAKTLTEVVNDSSTDANKAKSLGTSRRNWILIK